MPLLHLGRWIALRTLSSPIGLLAILSLIAAWPTLFVLAPIGISSSRVLPAEWSYELAFMGQAVGVLCGASALARLGPFLARAPTRRRWAVEFVLLVASGEAGALLALLPGMMWAGGSAAGAMISPSIGAAPALAAMAAGSTALSRARIPPATATWLLATGMLLAPMLLPQPTPLRSPILLGAAFALASRLMDHPPAEAR